MSIDRRQWRGISQPERDQGVSLILGLEGVALLREEGIQGVLRVLNERGNPFRHMRGYEHIDVEA